MKFLNFSKLMTMIIMMTPTSTTTAVVAADSSSSSSSSSSKSTATVLRGGGNSNVQDDLDLDHDHRKLGKGDDDDLYKNAKKEYCAMKSICGQEIDYHLKLESNVKCNGPGPTLVNGVKFIVKVIPLKVQD